MLKDILEHFPLKKYGAIALLLIFTLSCLYYYFAYRPFLETNRTYEFNCDTSKANLINRSIGLHVSIPTFVSNGSEITLTVANISPENMKNITINFVPDVIRYSRFTNITFEPINIESLSIGANENKVSRLTVVGMQDDNVIRLENVRVEFDNDVAVCDSLNSLSIIIIYNQLGSWIISVIGSVPAVMIVLFFIASISCSIFEDENQDFHPTSRTGIYYIARIFFRASIPLALFFIILYVITIDLLWNFGQRVYIFNITMLAGYIFVCFVAIKTITRLIKIRPKGKIIINSSEKVKEIEILGEEAKFNLQDFLAKILKRKKR